MYFDNIPQELKMNGLWCVWRLNQNGKVPYNAVTGELAKSNDKTTFHPFARVLENIKNYLKYEDGRQVGGLGLGLFNGYSAIDIDHCIDDNGQISEIARDIIDHCATYTEKSPSGHGVRIIFKTTTQLNKSDFYIKNSKLGLEIYISDQTNRFVTITGNVIAGGEVAMVDLTYILDKYMRRGAKSQLETALEKDKKFATLWNGTAPGSGQNESELDLALCSKLAYYLKNDKDAINRAFMSSPYFGSKDAKHKDKWIERQDYMEATITTALTPMSEIANDNDLTDTGNAHRYIDMFGGRVKYNIDNKAWMVYNGEHWQHDSTLMVKNYAELLAERMRSEAIAVSNETERKEQLKNVRRILSSSGKESMLKETQHLQGVPATNNDFDNDPWVLNTKSGLVDLRTREIATHDRLHMVSKICPFEVTHNEPKRWIKFLDEVFNGDKDLIHYVHKYVGYSLTGLTIEQCMFMLLGDGSNGKNVFLKIICDIMGSYAMTANTDMLLEQRNKSSGNLSDIARLNKIRLVVASETNPGAKLNEALIKSLTSGIEDIVARFLYGNEFQFRPIFKISMATNYKPIIRGTDNGIWRRIRIIPFNMTFDEEKKDKFLVEKLMAEASDILGWMIDGCLLWQKECLKEPKAIDDSTKEYRTEMDLIQRWINERCELGDGYRERSVTLFNSFLEYAKANKEFELSNTLFGRNLSRKFAKKIYGGATYYIGIKIKPYEKEEKYEEIRVSDDI